VDELLKMIVDAVTQHMPQSAAWIPYVGAGVVGVLGLALMFKGARLAPLICGLSFLSLGGLSASFLAHSLGTPVWPTIAAGAIIGLTLGLLLFKIWLAVLVAGCFAAVALSLYTGRVLAPHISTYVSGSVASSDPLYAIGLPEPAAQSTSSPQQELAKFWAYLGQQVDGFVPSFWAIILSTSLAGLVFGLLLPRTARALIAASAGTMCFFVGLTGMLKVVWPAGLMHLRPLGAWAWVIVIAAWCLALALNLRDMRSPRPRPLDAEGPAGSRPAVA